MTREDPGPATRDRPGISPTAVESGPEIIHVHIPKAAGTTFDAVLESVYGKEHVERDQSADTPRSLRGDPAAWRAQMRAEVEHRTSWPRVITGHFSLRRYERFRRSAFTIIWLREPAARLLSQYFYWHEQWSAHGTGADWALAFPPERIMEVKWPSNRVTSWLLRGYGLDDLDFVGIQEHFEEDVADLGRILGWPPVEIPVRNRNEMREYLDFRPSAELLRKIREANQADVAFYEQALERRRARRARGGASRTNGNVSGH
jgi:hypothetical protein